MNLQHTFERRTKKPHKQAKNKSSKTVDVALIINISIEDVVKMALIQQ